MGLRFQRKTLLLLGIFFLVMALDSVGVFASNSKPSEKSTGKPVVSRRQMNKNIYQVAHHALYVLVYLSLSAVFAGLTIGIMCMDTLTIDIIATSGPEPDRTYASQILPLRRQGHQTLCTLILSNMLLNVLVVQETAVLMDYVHELEAFGSIGWAVKENNDVTSFVLSTVLIFIFTEIIPTSICKSKHSLRIAAAGCVLVRIAMVLMYPVAISLGWLLDRFVAHDAGQIYDRNELRKLMILHCEAHGDRSGLLKSEVKLLMAAMEFQERRVRDIMTPVDQTTVVRAEEVITAEVIERLWNCGRSRIPVEQTPQKYIGVLLVKDLLTLPMPIGDRPPITIGELVKAKSRVFATVDANTLLPTLLRLFQQVQTQMFLVSREKEIAGESEETAPSYILLRTPNHLEAGKKIVGIVTLEDVTEALIKEEIYDEYDRYEFPSDNHLDCLTHCVHIHNKEIPMPFPEPAQVPRANFYSYYVHNTENIPLTEAQVWSVAYYLTRAVNAFFLWHPGYVKMLLDECGDQQLIPPQVGFGDEVAVENTGSSFQRYPPLNSPTKSENFDTVPTVPIISTSGEGQEFFSPTFLSVVPDECFVLYRDGVQTTVFTLVLGGTVQAFVGSSKFPLRRRSFQWFAEEALTLENYVPDFDAFVLSPTRVYRIPKDVYARYLRYNEIYTHTYDKIVMMGKKTTGMNQHASSHALSTQREEVFQKRQAKGDDREGLLKTQKESGLYGTFDESGK
ncbi:hypothetical protein TCDM_09447 [Trypanosoma cruzi Dm28c]|uniref:CNNM transmembrane domain-containing protein n=2 Tax=Trypanosoma cruzi TaxID=5693 RepID=V5B9W6_TRYCR|nr:hypothetical protein TCDM_09447 [Trypanosoma cruzi Dm28c]KAF8282455.1 hypothetical protein TcBrA4_0084760 [Trypanosoma cruzi]